MFASAPRGVSWTHLCVYNQLVGQLGRAGLGQPLPVANSQTPGPLFLHMDSCPALHGAEASKKRLCKAYSSAITGQSTSPPRFGGVRGRLGSPINLSLWVNVSDPRRWTGDQVMGLLKPGKERLVSRGRGVGRGCPCSGVLLTPRCPPSRL